MSRHNTDRYRRWFAYEQDAHAKVVRSLESVPAERRTTPEYRKSLSILGHIAAARKLWLHRMGIAPQGPGAIFPEGRELSAVADELRGVHSLWTDYLAGVIDEDLERTFTYQSLDSGRFRNSVEDILTQLSGHSWYHRGQIAMLVRAAGGEPAATDLVYWCREAIA